MLIPALTVERVLKHMVAEALNKRKALRSTLIICARKEEDSGMVLKADKDGLAYFYVILWA